MTEAKVVSIKQDKKKPRPRIEEIEPQQIIDVWRLSKTSIRETRYPDFTEEPDDHLVSRLLVDLQNPVFVGLTAKVGRRPVGLIWGIAQRRPCGKPSQYVQIQNLWVETGFRKQGVGRVLAYEFKKKMNQQGFFHFEKKTETPQELAFYQKIFGSQTSVLFTVIGGRL